jgi:hypothetical protein
MSKQRSKLFFMNEEKSRKRRLNSILEYEAKKKRMCLIEVTSSLYCMIKNHRNNLQILKHQYHLRRLWMIEVDVDESAT